MSIIYEACVENFQQALEAQQKGAQRIELCDNLYQGGTTPSYGTIQICQQTLKIPLAVMIRPRGGNYHYSQQELQIMKSDIDICKQLKVESVVFGVLTEKNEIDVQNCILLAEQAQPMNSVFHMAFDETPNVIESLNILIKTGKFKRILTKGGKFLSALGIKLIKNSQKK